MPKIPVPEPTPKGAYGTVTLSPVLSLFNDSVIPNVIKQYSDEPKTFEQLNIAYGYVLYETVFPSNVPDPALLYVNDLRDRAVVYVDEVCTDSRE